MDVLYNSLVAAATVSTPILLAALGGAVNRQGGIVNIGLEAKMLAGAFAAVVVSWQTGNVLLAVLAAGAAGVLVALPFTLIITRLGANEIMAGLGLNVAVAGLLGYLLPVTFGVFGTLAPPGPRAPAALAYPAARCRPGTWPHPVGARPAHLPCMAGDSADGLLPVPDHLGPPPARREFDGRAARAASIRALRWRDVSTLIAGLLCGLAGAQLAIGVVALFSTTITAGRGFIALAAFSRWRPTVANRLCGNPVRPVRRGPGSHPEPGDPGAAGPDAALPGRGGRSHRGGHHAPAA